MSESVVPSPDRLRQLERLSRVGDTAKWVVRSIRQWFPVEGGTWIFEGIADAPGIIPEVLNGLIYLDDILYPSEPQSDRFPDLPINTPLPRASNLAADWLIATPTIWRSVHLAVLAVMHSHERILHRYGLAQFISSRRGERGHIPLQWPAIPSIDPALLDALEKSSVILSEQVGSLKAAAQHLNSIAQRENQKTKGRKSRNRKSKTADLLLMLLIKDRTLLNKNQTELAELMGRSNAAVSRAFSSPKHSSQLLHLYTEHGVTPPTIHDI